MRADEIAVGSLVFIPAPSGGGIVWRPGEVVTVPRAGHPDVGVRPWGQKTYQRFPLDRVRHRMELAALKGVQVLWPR